MGLLAPGADVAGDESSTARQRGIPAESFSWLVWEKLPLLALSAASAVITMAAARTAEDPLSASIRLDNAIVSYANMWERPSGRRAWRPCTRIPETRCDLGIAYAALFLLVAITALVLAARRRRIFWSAGSGSWGRWCRWSACSRLAQGHARMADRYAYLPFLGLFIMICWGVADLVSQRKSGLQRAWLAGLSLAVLLVLAIVTHRQISYWSDNVSLWSHALQVTGANWLAENNLGKYS